MTQLTPAVEREHARLSRAAARWKTASLAGLDLARAIDGAAPRDASDFVKELTEALNGDLLLAQQVFDGMRGRGWLAYDFDTGTVSRGAKFPEG